MIFCRIVDSKQKLEQALKNEVQDKEAIAAKLRKVLMFLKILSLIRYCTVLLYLYDSWITVTWRKPSWFIPWFFFIDG